MTTALRTILPTHSADTQVAVPAGLSRTTGRTQSTTSDDWTADRTILSVASTPRVAGRQRHGQARQLDRKSNRVARRSTIYSSMLAAITGTVIVATGIATGTEAILFVVGSWSGHFIGFKSVSQQINAVQQ